MREPDFDADSLLARVRAGEAAAATELVASLLPLVRKIVTVHGSAQTTPEDLCQEVFLKVFARLDQYAGTVPFTHWVARVALNTARDAGRKAGRDRAVRLADLTEAEQALVLQHPAPETAADRATCLAARELAARLLATLSPEDRLVLTLLDLEGRTAPEVRAQTGWSVTAIRVRAFRARRRLRRELTRLSGEVSP